ncbi:MAG: thiamine pyrophosphate-binding protein [Cyanobium sp.]
MKYCDALIGWLKASGYSHCYFVAGGNIMHLLNSARQQLVCVPVVHEVAAAIATEYHNATVQAGAAAPGIGKAMALVTAGPGLTNTLTGLAGAWLESRELLLLGGQVKVEDLAPPGLRQLGIQEVNGVAMAAPVCKRSLCLREPLPAAALLAEVAESWDGRPGPVFLEMPLDVQAVQVPEAWAETPSVPLPELSPATPGTDPQVVADLAQRIGAASRPVLLLGGGLSHRLARALEPQLAALALPIMTTWNGADRYPADHSNYAGRPNTWGQRSSKIILQQADLVVALGSRLGLQQTGFNWRQFVPLGEVIQVDIDPAELAKPNPNLSAGIQADANRLLELLLAHHLGNHNDWLSFCQEVRSRLPLCEPCNTTPDGYLNPYTMIEDLARLCEPKDHIVPCSSGGAFTVMMQAFTLRSGQTMTTDKGLASMGYGLSGAIGVAIADPGHRTVLVEGDGGFTQTLQELATVAVNQLNLKMFLFCNDGYASIRMTQKNYFDGAYLGCDVSSGLGFPDWQVLAEAYRIPALPLTENWFADPTFLDLWQGDGPALFLVPLHPEQTYFPKISSRISASGGMESNPLHLMTPELNQKTAAFVMRYLPQEPA